MADPLIVYSQQYAELSSYQFASNTPVQAIDLDGLEPEAPGGYDGLVVARMNRSDGKNYGYQWFESVQLWEQSVTPVMCIDGGSHNTDTWEVAYLRMKHGAPVRQSGDKYDYSYAAEALESYKRMHWQPDAIGFTLGGNFVFGMGAGKSFTLLVGVHPENRFQVQLYGNADAHVGNDISVGTSFNQVDFTIPSKWRDAYTGACTGAEVGIGGVTGSIMKNVDSGGGQVGNISYSADFGFSLGTDQLPVGAINGQAVFGTTYRINMPWQKEQEEILRGNSEETP